MSHPARYLPQCLLGIEIDRDIPPLLPFGALDDISERGGTELEGDIQKVAVRFLVVVADDVGVVVGFLEDGDFACGEGYKVV